VLNHSQHNFRKRSTQEDLDEIEDWTDRAAGRMYEGAGLSAAARSLCRIETDAHAMSIDGNHVASVRPVFKGGGQPHAAFCVTST
jgi:hypothetical protein